MVVVKTDIARQLPRRSMMPLQVGLQMESHIPAKRTADDLAGDSFIYVLGASEISVEEISRKFGAASEISVEEVSRKFGAIELKPTEEDKNTDTGASSSGASSPSVAITEHTPILKRQMRQCAQCKTVDHWRFLRRAYVTVHYQQTKWEPPDEQVEVHTCIPCVAIEMNCTEEAARTFVLGIPITHKKQRYDNLMQGKAEVAKKILAMESSCSRAQRRELTKKCMIELFGPLAKHTQAHCGRRSRTRTTG